MGSVSVDQILSTPLRKIEVPGGNVMHGMKASDNGYDGFGEAYFSWVEKDFIKAWKLHTKMTLNLVVPVGLVRIVFVSPDEVGKYRIEEIGESNYCRLTVPPGLWFGFMGVAESTSLLLNIANIIHEPTETIRKEITDFDFNWHDKSKK